MTHAESMQVLEIERVHDPMHWVWLQTWQCVTRIGTVAVVDGRSTAWSAPRPSPRPVQCSGSVSLYDTYDTYDTHACDTPEAQSPLCTVINPLACRTRNTSTRGLYGPHHHMDQA